MKKHSAFLLAFFSSLIALSSLVATAQSQPLGTMDPLTIPKWVNQLDGPIPVYVSTNITDDEGNVMRQDYVVAAAEFTQQMLPTTDASGNPTGFGATKVWGYGGLAKDPVTGQFLGYVAGTPGPTFKAIRGVPLRVKWINGLVDAYGQTLGSFLPVDPTLHWANPKALPMPSMPVNAPPFPPGYLDAQRPAALVTHLHGAEVPSAYDGNPDAWFTVDGSHGSAYRTVEPTEANSAVYEYPNGQEPTTLWYHDHALGVTRLNVLSGLVGFYLLRDPADQIASLLPSGKYDVPLCIQDRTFLTDGSLYYPPVGTNPEAHPYWPETFLGDTIIVNGKVWPNMNVERGLYRFRLLDASNSRFYLFSFSNSMPFIQIGSDGGYLRKATPLTSLLMGPGERADVLVDFSALTPGTKVTLQNLALTTTTEAEKQTIGQIMQFTVIDGDGFFAQPLPEELNPTLAGSYPTLQHVDNRRTLSLIEASGDMGTLAMYIDGQEYVSPVSEIPEVGTTEEWVIVNPTISAHTIHLHLVQFQIVSRQLFNDSAYMTDWTALNGVPPLNHSTVNLQSLEPYLIGEPRSAEPNEFGWKDTAVMFSGEVTTIRIRFTQQDGEAFPFDATAGPGYVWHCHLLEHEDNEMMRTYTLTQFADSNELPIENLFVIAVAVAVAVVVVAFVVVIWRRIHK